MATIDTTFFNTATWTDTYTPVQYTTRAGSFDDLERMVLSNTEAITNINKRLEDLANLLETIDESLQVIAGRSA